MNPDDSTEKETQLTLKNYLDGNKDLLVILGIFVAIVAFCNNLGVKLLAAFISFSSFTCAMLVLIELWRKPINGIASSTVKFFRIALFCLAFGFFLVLVHHI
ncbi:MAG: hypothetical protein ACYC49_00200 [Ignavibacteriaceae bacterium]